MSEPKLSALVTRPDGIRSWGDGLLATDGTGKILHIHIHGDSATVTTVKDGANRRKTLSRGGLRPALKSFRT